MKRTPFGIHEFAVKQRLTAKIDREAAERYRGLAARSEEEDLRAEWIQRAIDCDASAERALEEIDVRLRGGKPRKSP